MFVNLTAAWCITCLVNERVALRSPRGGGGLCPHRASSRSRRDWTSRDPQITQVLDAFGRSGVPLYLLYASGRTPSRRQPAVLPQILTEAGGRSRPSSAIRSRHTPPQKGADMTDLSAVASFLGRAGLGALAAALGGTLAAPRAARVPPPKSGLSRARVHRVRPPAGGAAEPGRRARQDRRAGVDQPRLSRTCRSTTRPATCRRSRRRAPRRAWSGSR